MSDSLGTSTPRSPLKPRGRPASVYLFRPPPERRQADDGTPWCATCDRAIDDRGAGADFCTECSKKRAALRQIRSRLTTGSHGRKVDPSELGLLANDLGVALDNLLAIKDHFTVPKGVPLDKMTPSQLTNRRLAALLKEAQDALGRASTLIWLDGKEPPRPERQRESQP